MDGITFRCINEESHYKTLFEHYINILLTISKLLSEYV